MPNRDNSRPAKRNERVQKIRRRRRVRILLCSLAVVLVVLVVLSLTIFFPIEKISVSIGAHYTAEQVIEASDIDIGDNLITVGWFGQSKKIQTKLPYIKSVSYNKNLDGTLIIETKLTSDKYAFIGAKKSYVTDRDLKILHDLSEHSDDITTVYLYGDLSGQTGYTGQLTDAADASLFAYVVDIIEQYGITANVIDLTRSYNIAVKVSDRFVVELGSKSDFESKLAHLAVMLERIDEGKNGVIDLSSWTVTNEEAYFKEKDITDYFSERHAASESEQKTDNEENDSSVVESSSNVS